MDGFWWSEPLFRWVREMEVECRVERYPTSVVKRSPGEWWKREEHWCVHLDDHHFAAVFDADLDARLRKSFTWALSLVSELRPMSWKRQIVSWMESLNERTSDALFLAGSDSVPLPVGEKFPYRLPGHVVWMHFDPHSYGEPSRRDDLRQIVEQIVQAYLPNSFAGWMESDDFLSAVMFFSPDPADSASDVMPDADHLAQHQDQVKAVLEELVQMIASDALVACRAAVGAPVRSVREVYWGAATAIAVWRERDWTGKSQKVSLWSEQYLAHLLCGLSDEACKAYLRIAALRSPEQNLALTPDLIEALNGVVAANLNVSEAARLLYLHRNTLINRIERLKQQTGYDIRNFSDAFTLWTVSAIQTRLNSRADK
jgi:hypothetical protein